MINSDRGSLKTMIYISGPGLAESASSGSLLEILIFRPTPDLIMNQETLEVGPRIWVLTSPSCDTDD